MNINIYTNIWKSVWKPCYTLVCSKLNTGDVDDLVFNPVYSSVIRPELQIKHKEYEY